MFAPTDKDYKGVQLFTGEKVKTGAGISHILGEESLRALYLLKAKGKEIDEAVLGAKEGLKNAMDRSKLHGYYEKGTYCCAACTVAYWSWDPCAMVKAGGKDFPSITHYLRFQVLI